MHGRRCGCSECKSARTKARRERKNAQRARTQAQERQHGTKVPYRNQTRAERAAGKATSAYGVAMQAYRCRWCGYWHIGNAEGGNSA